MFRYRNRPFVSVPGQGEAELFALAETVFTIRVVPGVKVVFKDEGGNVTGVRIELGRQAIEGRRR